MAPSFGDAAVFRDFASLPPVTATAASGGGEDPDWYLLAQIKNNMTIMKPTLIVTDRRGVEFAVTFEEDREFDLKGRGLKKGNTMVVPRARRTAKGEGKNDVVVIQKGASVAAIPAKLDRVLELGPLLDDASSAQKCAECGKAEESISKCTGCESVAYCGKDCQIKGWNESGHKADCKTLKAIKQIF
ncbi:hypothetical protein BX600DRAFT_496170 [Xylariales sp. PMI_506]|nr:hypothetical protein BX600DRAFT_496170 [Xylariales sp. PMI_506]